MTDATAFAPELNSSWSAFHGDPQLAEFLLNRLRWHAKAGHLEVSRRPYWRAGKGTTSAALVHNADPRVFERITGLPYSLGLVLELAAVRTVDEVEQIAAALRPGLDTENVAARVLRSWFLEPANRWPELIDDAEVNQLRLDWLNACEQWLSDQREVDWQSLAARAKALIRPEVVLRTVQNSLLEMFQKLCPPPPSSEVDTWISLTVGAGVHCKFMVAQSAFGWTASDFAKEVELFQWFTEREKQEPGGKFNDATLRVAQAEWAQLPKDLDYIAKEHYFFQHTESAFTPINARLRAMLVTHLNALGTPARR
jgi:thioredoxin 1